MARYIPEDILEEIRRKADIVELVSSVTPVKKRGSSFWACCPFHKEKTASFSINQQRQIFYCFGCKKSGNIFHFVQDTQNTDFPGSVEWLADRLGIIIPEEQHNMLAPDQRQARQQKRRDGMQLLQEAGAYFQENLQSPAAAIARNYLSARGLSQEVIEQFQLGFSYESWDALLQWALQKGYSRELLVDTGLCIAKEEQPEHCYDRFRGRLMFPILDEQGRLVGFSARSLDSAAKTAKYVNSPESAFFNKSEILYGMHLARKEFRSTATALLCEGQMDVIACHQAGIKNAIAAQGTAFTEQHATLLKRSTDHVTIIFDGDQAGLDASLKSAEILLKAGLHTVVANLPEGQDPDSILNTGGPKALQQMLKNSLEAIPFAFNLSCQKHDYNLPEGKSAIVSDTLALVAVIPDVISRTAHCQWLAKQTQLPEDILFDRLTSIMREDQQRQQQRFFPAKPLQTQQQAPAFNMPVNIFADQQSSTLIVILDLIMHFDFLAQELACSEIQRLIPDSPLGHAINLVCASAEQNEWEMVPQTLAASELIANPEVAQVMAQSKFTDFMKIYEEAPKEENGEKRRIFEEHKKVMKELLKKALKDCENKLLLQEIDKKTQENIIKLQTVTDDKERITILQECQKLNQKKMTLIGNRD